MQDPLTELIQLTTQASSQPTPTGIPGLVMISGAVPEHQLAAVYEPMIGLTLQGRKLLTVGEQVYACEAGSYFVLPVDLPATALVQQGPQGKPYLSLGLSIQPERLLSLLEEQLPLSPKQPISGFGLSPANDQLLDAWRRLLKLMHSPEDIPALAAAYEREILYRVLKGPHGALLREMASPKSALSEIRSMISWIRRHLTESFQVEHLAQQVGMSESVFYRHFRAATGLSPIQFQKRLRLLEARKSLISSQQSAAQVAWAVGYESVTQFNREYSRLFGSPPATDASRIRRALAI